MMKYLFFLALLLTTSMPSLAMEKDDLTRYKNAFTQAEKDPKEVKTDNPYSKDYGKKLGLRDEETLCGVLLKVVGDAKEKWKNSLSREEAWNSEEHKWLQGMNRSFKDNNYPKLKAHYHVLSFIVRN